MFICFFALNKLLICSNIPCRCCYQLSHSLSPKARRNREQLVPAVAAASDYRLPKVTWPLAVACSYWFRFLRHLGALWLYGYNPTPQHCALHKADIHTSMEGIYLFFKHRVFASVCDPTTHQHPLVERIPTLQVAAHWQCWRKPLVFVWVWMITLGWGVLVNQNGFKRKWYSQMVEHSTRVYHQLRII